MMNAIETELRAMAAANPEMAEDVRIALVTVRFMSPAEYVRQFDAQMDIAAARGDVAVMDWLSRTQRIYDAVAIAAR